MTEKTVKIGDEVAWADVPDGAMVRGVAFHGREAFYFRHMDDGWYVGGVAPLTARRDFLDIPPHGNCWPAWNDWRGAPKQVTIVALGLTGQETAADLQRLAEVFEVREALADINWPAWPSLQADIAAVFTVTDAADLAKRLAERLHALGWRKGQTAEDAARLLRGAT